jgi:hypothetical protein
MANYLDLVLKLLAKAEGTNNDAERETYLAKAQELATNHQIEQGLIDRGLADRGQQVSEGFVQKRFCEERNTKLIKAKRDLVCWLADVNNCYVVLGYKRAYLEVTGHESDVLLVHHLYASILLQLQRAMAQAEDAGHVVGGLQGWRVSFAHGYVRRVGLRLNDAKLARMNAADSAPGSALVLRDRAALSKEFAEGTYGTLRKGRRIPRSDNNVFGRVSGDEAGQRADLGGDRLGAGTTNRKEIGS